MMRDLSLKFKSLLKTERPLSYHLEVAQVRLQPLAVPALAGATLALGAAAAMLATKLPLEMTLLALAGLAVVLVAFSKPEFVVLSMLVASSSIFHVSDVPTIKVGFAFTVIELCLIFLLGLVVAQALAGREAGYVGTPLDLPIALFFLASFVSLINSVFILGTDVDLMEYRWRILFGYFAFFAVTNLVRTRQQLLLLVTGMFVIAAIVAILMIVQQAVGTSVVILPGRVETASVFEEDFASVTRILPPGESLILVMFMPAFILFITRERLGITEWLLLFTIFLLLIALAFTFNRNMWIGTTMSIGAVFFLSTRNQRKNLLLFLCVIMVFGAIVIPLLSMDFPKLGDVFNALYLRGASLFTGDRVKYSSSWQWRVRENEYAMIKIRQHPILGIGPGNHYRPRWSDGDNNLGYMHNSYLYILMDFGIVGFVPFVWFSIMFLIRGYRLWLTIQDKVFMAVVLGFTLTYVTFLIAGIAAPAFMEWYCTPVLGVMFGVNEVIYQLNREATGLKAA